MKRKVTVALWMGGASGRRQLVGVLRYATHRNWDIRILQNITQLTAEIVQDAERGHSDGLIVGLVPDSPETSNAVVSSKMPVVSLGLSDYTVNKTNACLIKSDNRQIGRLGAEHLLTLGKFNSFGFITDRLGREWATEREAGFTGTLRKSGEKAYLLIPSDDPAGHEAAPPREELAEWIRSLRKPAAIMAACDYLAVHVLETCNGLGQNVPRTVAIIGADNDESLCENHRPALTSIDMDFESQGYSAAERLDRLMDHERVAQTFISPSCRVVARESTRPLSPSAALVSRATAFIAGNACRGIDAGDVATHLGVSRRLSDLRFAQITGTTVGAEIERVKMENVKRLLRDSDRTIVRIASMSGYANPDHLGQLFKKRFGLTMSDFRRSARSTAEQGTEPH